MHKKGWLCFTEILGGFFEKILLNNLGIVWADVVKTEQNFFFYILIVCSKFLVRQLLRPDYVVNITSDFFSLKSLLRYLCML